MSQYAGERDFEHGEVAAVGVLVTNVGTPQAPTTPALRRYLKQFLSDPRVIENQGLMWSLILNGIILRTRPSRSAEGYRKIWTEEGSPLLAITRKQVAGLETRLRERIGSPLHVAPGMGYGEPSIRSGLEALQRKGCRRILVIPLYPQYAAATTGSTFDAVAEVLKSWRWVPELRFVTNYHDDPAYIRALAASIREFWGKVAKPEKLLVSFHGLPKRYLLEGDPYHCQCHKTARLLIAELGLQDDEWQLAFQSRFGREEWLKPYTDETLKSWGRAGVKSVNVVCPGFSADCLETIEEIGEENRGYFQAAGGGEYRYIPALNDRADHMEALASLAERNLCGWAIKAGEWVEGAARKEAEASRLRAEQMKREGLNG